jgi:hypothetical protein
MSMTMQSRTTEPKEFAILDETLPPLEGAADLSDDEASDGSGDGTGDNEANDDDANGSPPDSQPDSPTLPDTPPEPQKSPTTASATLGTLRAIAEAETLCANAEEAVAEARAVLKEARAEYDGCVINLRKLAKALRSRPAATRNRGSSPPSCRRPANSTCNTQYPPLHS